MVKVAMNPANMTRSLLPIPKRQPNRIKILNCLLYPLYLLFNDFLRWQAYIRSFRVTSQVIVLENYLNKKYNAQIIIETSHDGGVEVSMSGEGRYYIDAGGDTIKEIPLTGEMQEYFQDCDFVVHVPQGVVLEDVGKDVERFRRAGKKVIYKQI